MGEPRAIKIKGKKKKETSKQNPPSLPAPFFSSKNYCPKSPPGQSAHMSARSVPSISKLKSGIGPCDCPASGSTQGMESGSPSRVYGVVAVPN